MLNQLTRQTSQCAGQSSCRCPSSAVVEWPDSYWSTIIWIHAYESLINDAAYKLLRLFNGPNDTNKAMLVSASLLLIKLVLISPPTSKALNKKYEVTHTNKREFSLLHCGESNNKVKTCSICKKTQFTIFLLLLYFHGTWLSIRFCPICLYVRVCFSIKEKHWVEESYHDIVYRSGQPNVRHRPTEPHQLPIVRIDRGHHPPDQIPEARRPLTPLNPITLEWQIPRLAEHGDDHWAVVERDAELVHTCDVSVLDPAAGAYPREHVARPVAGDEELPERTGVHVGRVRGEVDRDWQVHPSRSTRDLLGSPPRLRPP